MRVLPGLVATCWTVVFGCCAAQAQQWNGAQNATGNVHRPGRVGLGTTAPQDALHVFRTGAATAGVLMGNGLVPAGRRGFLIDYHHTGGAELWNFENTDMWFGTNGARRMTIAKDGRVGIGTLPHTFGFSFDSELKLDVQGRVRVHNVEVWDGPGQFDLTWARGCHSSGSTTVCGFLEGTRIITRESSSRRYKQNVRPVRPEQVAKVLDLQAVEYEMREGHGPKGWSTVGFMAEDVAQAGLDDLVAYDEEGRPDGVKYKRVAVYLTEVVKEQQKAIRELQDQVAALRRRLDAPGPR